MFRRDSLFENSIKFILRTPVKSIVFTVMIAAISVMLYFGVSLWDESYNGIQQAKRDYKTVGTVTQNNIKNLTDANLEFIESSKYVEVVDNRNIITAYNNEFVLDDEELKLIDRFAVFEATRLERHEETNFDMSQIKNIELIDNYERTIPKTSIYRIREVIYGGHYQNYSAGDYIIITNANALNPHMDRSRINATRGRTYLMNLYNIVPECRFTTSNFYFEPDVLSYIDATIWTDQGSRTYKAIKKSIEIYEKNLRSVSIVLTDNLNMMLKFHNNEAKIVEGREISADEYKNGANVCLISKAFSDTNGFKIGQEIDMTLTDAFKAEKNIRNSSAGVYSDGTPGFMPMKGDIEEHTKDIGTKSYEIIGFYEAENYNSYYDIPNSTIIAPKSSISEDIIEMVYRPEELIKIHENKGAGLSMACIRTHQQRLPYRTVATYSFLLKSSDDAEKFLEEFSDKRLDTRYKMVLYDQGYSNVAKALKEMQKIAVILTATCIGSGIVVITLFVYMFIIKRQKDLAIMLSIGMSKLKAVLIIVSSIIIISLIGSVVGAVIGNFFYDDVKSSIFDNIEEQKENEIMYYNPNYVSSNEVSVKIEYQISKITILYTVVLMILFTLLLSSYGIRKLVLVEPLELLSKKEGA